MPVPGGEITTTELWQAPVEQELPEVVEEVVDLYDKNQEVYEAALSDAIEKAKDDLPELS
jgi:cation transport regulator ChaB